MSPRKLRSRNRAYAQLTFSSGRGRLESQRPPGGAGEAINITSSNDTYFLRPAPLNGLDSVAFHYSIYRNFQRLLGLDGNLAAGYDLPLDFVEAWNQILAENDFINAFTGEIDPRHLYGMTNFDILRWDGLVNGTQKSTLGMFIASLVLPGAPLVSSRPLLNIRVCRKLI